MDVLRSKQVKIRKPHKCWGCLRTFPAGTMMDYVVGVDGGEMYSVYWCDICQTVMSKMNFDDGDGIGAGDLIAEYRELYETMPPGEK